MKHHRTPSKQIRRQHKRHKHQDQPPDPGHCTAPPEINEYPAITAPAEPVESQEPQS